MVSVNIGGGKERVRKGAMCRDKVGFRKAPVQQEGSGEGRAAPSVERAWESCQGRAQLSWRDSRQPGVPQH